MKGIILAAVLWDALYRVTQTVSMQVLLIMTNE
jgi:hypothetical protein